MTKDQAAKLRLLVDGRREGAEDVARAGRSVLILGAKGGVGTTTIALNLAILLSVAGECVELSPLGSPDAPLVAGPGGVLLRDPEHWRNVLSGIHHEPILSVATEADPESWCEIEVLDAGTGRDADLAAERRLTLLVATREPAAMLETFETLREASATGWWPEVVMNRGPLSEDRAATRLDETVRRVLGRRIVIHALSEDASVLDAARLGVATALAHPGSRFTQQMQQLAARVLAEASVRAA